MLRFGQHVGHLHQPLAAYGTHAVQLVAPHEAHQQLGDVIHERRIGHAQPSVKRVLGQPGKEAANCRRAKVRMHRALPPRAPLHIGSKSVEQSPRWGPAGRSQLTRLRPPHSVPIRVGLGDRRSKRLLPTTHSILP